MKSKPTSNLNTTIKSNWNPDLEQLYKDTFNRSHIDSLNIAIDNADINNISQADIDELTDQLCCLYLDPAKAIGICKVKRMNFRRKIKTYNQP